MVAILSLALVYAFACSATCAICSGADEAAVAQSHGCRHAAGDATGGSQRQTPAKPNCFRHHHSDFEAVQSDGLSRIQLSARGGASQLFVGVVDSEVVIVASSFLSDLAPPRDVADSSQQIMAVLRI